MEPNRFPNCSRPVHQLTLGRAIREPIKLFRTKTDLFTA